jgi:hypothetical protein
VHSEPDGHEPLRRACLTTLTTQQGVTRRAADRSGVKQILRRRLKGGGGAEGGGACCRDVAAVTKCLINS